MLKGDLTSTPLASLLLELADDSATGCLVITDLTEDEALVYFKNGLIYSVWVPGNRPQLGAKLVSSGALAPEALAEALEAQRTELQGWRLGELLVHLGYVEQPVVEAFVAEQVSEAMWDLLRWSDGRWKFRKNVKAREDVGPPMAVGDLLETLRARGYQWETISAVVHGPSAVPRLSTRGDTSTETTLDNDAWSMLCKIDGERSVAELAADCGYTLFEAGHVIVSLVQAGLVDIDEDIDLEGNALYGATTLSSALAGEVEDVDATPAESSDEDAMTRLVRLVNEVAATGEITDDTGVAAAAAEPAAVAPTQRQDRELDNSSMTVSVNRHSGESFAASIARVSGALSDVLGEVPPPDIDTEELAARRRRTAPSTDDPEWQRRKRLRSAAAAELASAQALIETLRPDRDAAAQPPVTPEFTGDVPKLESATAERDRMAARDAEDAERRAADEAAREAAEQFARAAAEEAERVAAETEAARIAAEQAAQEAAAAEVARLEAEAAAQLAAEQAAEQARLDAERAAAEEAARVAAEAEAAAAEAERLQAERQAAEEAAWAEYWQREEAERAAAEEAARAEAEAERLAAEEAAWAEYWQREEAERAAAEEAARAEAEAERLAAEEAARQAETERIAAEEAARQAETERLAAEEAARQAETERLAAEEAARQAEADRIAAEEAERQAERLAAEEAERVAAEAEAERIAAEEAERQAAAEAEAERVAAAAEVERLAAEAEAEAARISAEEAERQAAAEAEAAAAEAEAEAAARRKAEKEADAEAAKRGDEAAAAAALLAEFAASSTDEPEPARAEATPRPKPEPKPEPEAPAADEMREPVPAGRRWSDADGTDTAALLRELSSLGNDDDRDVPTGPAMPSRPRPNTPDKKVKKKIGLFGL